GGRHRICGAGRRRVGARQQRRRSSPRPVSGPRHGDSRPNCRVGRFRHVHVSSRVRLPLRIASIGAATVAFGSPVWSVSADALWTHGVTHVSLLCALIAIKKGKAGGAALWFGISVLTRPHLIVVPLILTLFRLDRRVLLGGVAGGLAGLGLSGLYSLVVFGRIIPSGGYNVDGLSQSAPLRSAAGLAGNIWGWLADPLHGIVVWVPLALIAAVGVPLVWRNLDPLIRAAAVAGMAYAAAQLSLIRASGGNIFLGHRTTIETFVLATPLIVASLWALMSSSRAARVLISTLIAYSVAIHAYAAWIDMHPFVREFIEDLQSRMRSDQS